MLASTTLQALANSGVNLSLDGPKYAATSLHAAANTCKKLGTHLTIRNGSGLASTTLHGLASTLKGNLTIED